MMLCGILAGGHVLLEDIPGVGKTTLAVTLSKALSLDQRRVQFTPDVMPSDILGFNMFDKASGSFRFMEGAVYTNLFLADEINRTSPKTQSALLEVMEEGAATVEGVTRQLPRPFFVIATENPYGSSGTQKLPESQLDRFLLSLTMGYPDRSSAIDVLKGDSKQDIVNVRAVTDAAGIIAMQDAVSELHVDETLLDYIVRICEQTRKGRYFELGLSPRGSIAILKTARAYAYTEGRDYLIP
jgi:MoxR-like ATPase